MPSAGGKFLMEGLFHITLPQTVSEMDVDAIQSKVRALDVITDTGCMATRSLDPSSVMVWVQLVSGTLSLLGTAVTLIQKVIEIIRGKGISGATIKLPNGAEISVDNATASDIEKCLRAVAQK
jgi:hypothetical protein